MFSVLQLPSSPSAHDVFSSPITPSSGARRNLFSSSPSAQSAPPVTLSATTRQAAARNAPTCKCNKSYQLFLDIWKRVLTWSYSQTSLVQKPKGQSVASILWRCLYYRGKDCLNSGFFGPSELSIVGVCKERFDCTTILGKLFFLYLHPFKEDCNHRVLITRKIF